MTGLGLKFGFQGLGNGFTSRSYIIIPCSTIVLVLVLPMGQGTISPLSFHVFSFLTAGVLLFLGTFVLDDAGSSSSRILSLSAACTPRNVDGSSTKYIMGCRFRCKQAALHAQYRHQQYLCQPSRSLRNDLWPSHSHP